MSGDFNISFLDFSESKKEQSFVNLPFHFGMIHIFTKSIINTEIKTAIAKTGISDHFPIFFPIYQSRSQISTAHF